MSITRVPKALDVDCILDGARAALLASGAVAAITTRIYPRQAPEGAASPYIVLALASTVYESTYNTPTINTLLDVSCYVEGWSTATVRALTTACLAALIDAPWTAAGLTIESANMEEAGTGIRDVDDVTSGKMVRGKQATIRVRAMKV